MLNVNQMIEWAAVILILIGSIVSVISAFGMIRLPDVYTRSHAATKSSTLSVLTCLLERLSISGCMTVLLVYGLF